MFSTQLRGQPRDHSLAAHTGISQRTSYAYLLASSLQVVNGNRPARACQQGDDHFLERLTDVLLPSTVQLFDSLSARTGNIFLLQHEEQLGV